MVVTTVEEPQTPPVVATVKRSHDGEPIAKQVRPATDGVWADARRPVRVAPLPTVEPPIRSTVRPLVTGPAAFGYRPPEIAPVLPPLKAPSQDQAAPKPKKTKKHKKKKAGLTQVQAHAPQYDVVNALANTPCGLTFGQLARGDAEAAQTTLRRLLGRAKPKRVLAAGDYEEAPKPPRKHRKVDGTIRGVEVPIVIDTGAIPNLMSEATMKRLGLALTRVGASSS